MSIKPERIYKYGSTLCTECGALVALRRDLEPVRHGKRRWLPAGCPGGNRPGRGAPSANRLAEIGALALSLRDRCKASYAEGRRYARQFPEEQFDAGDSHVYIEGRRYNVLTVLGVLEACGVSDCEPS